MTRRPTALGIPSPWSGDGHDPIPWQYWWWFRLYHVTRLLRHWLRLHDWDTIRPEDGSAHRYCTWCGQRRDWL